MLIAERIVALHPREDFYALVLWAGSLSPKLKFYGDRLMAQCSLGGAYIEDVLQHVYPPFFSSRWEQIKTIWRFYKLQRLYAQYTKGVGKVYVSSYEKFTLKVVLSCLSKCACIYSFDDGFMNLSPIAYVQNKVDLRGGRTLQWLSIPDTSDITGRVQGHYTIYDGYNAAYDKPTKIELFAFEGESVSANVTEVVKLFLGQPIFEPDDEASRAVTQAAIEASGCNYYLPHPRETYRIEGIEYIETNYIAEDYLLRELQEHPGRSYELHSFFTTTMLNLKGHPRIKSVAYRPSKLLKKWEESYCILRERGIEVVEFELK